MTNIAATALGFPLMVLMAATSLYAQFGSGHKSEEQIARMTPDQRVEEYCREHARHLFTSHDDDEYVALVTKYLRQDGLKVMPQVIREIDAYDPTARAGASEEKFRRYQSCPICKPLKIAVL